MDLLLDRWSVIDWIPDHGMRNMPDQVKGLAPNWCKSLYSAQISTKPNGLSLTWSHVMAWEMCLIMWNSWHQSLYSSRSVNLLQLNGLTQNKSQNITAWLLTNTNHSCTLLYIKVGNTKQNQLYTVSYDPVGIDIQSRCNETGMQDVFHTNFSFSQLTKNIWLHIGYP